MTRPPRRRRGESRPRSPRRSCRTASRSPGTPRASGGNCPPCAATRTSPGHAPAVPSGPVSAGPPPPRRARPDRPAASRHRTPCRRPGPRTPARPEAPGRIGSPVTERIDCAAPQYAFARRDHSLVNAYERGFRLNEFMPLNQIGFQSHRDTFAIAFDRAEMEKRLNDMMDAKVTDDELRERYGLSDNSGWKLATARSKAREDPTLNRRILPCDYRPFDRRFCMLHEAAMDRPRWTLLGNVLLADNFGLNFVRQTKSASWQHGLVSRYPVPAVFVEIKDGSNFAPLPCI